MKIQEARAIAGEPLLIGDGKVRKGTRKLPSGVYQVPVRLEGGERATVRVSDDGASLRYRRSNSAR